MPSPLPAILLLSFVAVFSACSSGGSGGSGGSATQGTNAGAATLAIVSNRPDLISGGDALVEVMLSSADAVDDIEISRNGSPVDFASTFAPTADNPLRYLGVVDGLVVGENTISSNLGNNLVVRNHPKGGPVFTGPQIQPWTCQNTAEDDQCNQPVQYDWLYKPTDSNALEPYDPQNPPTDVDTANTDSGESIPFVVRREIGFQARDEYNIYKLFKEGEDWTAAQPQSQWNGQLLATHGGNCRGHHAAKEVNGDAPDTADYAGTVPETPAIANSYVTALGKGWSVIAVAQVDLGHNCNMSYQAEALMMAKERFIEQYGELRYTIGTGCSGGAITQNMIANAYPGLYQGLITTCTYPDVMSTATQFADYHILLRRFNDPATALQIGLTPVAMNLVLDHPNGLVNATAADTALFSEAVNPESDCSIAEGTGPDARYDNETNTVGARCDVLTFQANMVGERQPDRRSDIENALGRSFVGFPLGNEGVQYGLVPLQQGLINATQFIALNRLVGGVNHDLDLTEDRLQPDTPAIPNAYRTGILNTIVNMDSVPIINATGPDPAIAHDTVHAFWVRWRFDREFGHHDNHVMWGGPAPLIGDPNYMNLALDAMSSWLDAIEADSSATPLAQKIIINRPTDVQDQCSNGSGVIVSTGSIYDCSEVTLATFGTPRTAAGETALIYEGTPDEREVNFGDQLQCQLKPFDENDDYGLVPLLPAQVEELRTIFATGVCDWNQRPLGWTPTITWLNYQDAQGNVITGCEQMDPAPFPSGWASESFHSTWEPYWQAP